MGQKAWHELEKERGGGEGARVRGSAQIN